MMIRNVIFLKPKLVSGSIIYISIDTIDMHLGWGQIISNRMDDMKGKKGRNGKEQDEKWEKRRKAERTMRAEP